MRKPCKFTCILDKISISKTFVHHLSTAYVIFQAKPVMLGISHSSCCSRETSPAIPCHQRFLATKYYVVLSLQLECFAISFIPYSLSRSSASLGWLKYAVQRGESISLKISSKWTGVKNTFTLFPLFYSVSGSAHVFFTATTVKVTIRQCLCLA